MGLAPGTPLSEIAIDTVFIGSCTNGRIEDLRAAAAILKGRKVKEGLRAMVVPGSGLVRAQAEEEGLADIFREAGFEWRLAGCSMCLAMNPDQLAPGERCAATSNRNFEGRQGRGGRTHLMSPAMAAAAAVTGRLTDVREFLDPDAGQRGRVSDRLHCAASAWLLSSSPILGLVAYGSTDRVRRVRRSRHLAAGTASSLTLRGCMP